MTQHPVAVAPSSGGSDRQNPVVLPPGGTFELSLELPEGAHSTLEAWELTSVDGRYARRLARADAAIDPQTAQAKLVFTGLYTDASYTLVHQGETEAQIVVFAEVAFAELSEHGGTTSAPEARESDAVESEPDVQAESQHTEVQHDPALDELVIENSDADDHDDDLPTILAPPEERPTTDDDAGSGLTNPERGAPAPAPATPPGSAPR